MSILFVLLMFLLIMTFSYFRTRNEVVRPQPSTGPQAPRMEREYGFQIPQGYCFHPGHTWSLKEGTDNARIGIDTFAANLMGKIDEVKVIGENRWVRQGQKVMTIRCGKDSFDLVSPVEGVITAINHDVVDDPTLAARDPYQKGWIALVKSPDLPTNQKNLVQDTMVAPWLQNNVTRLNSMVAQLAPTMAADGGVPIPGLLARVEPDVRQKLIKEFFLG
ncbi:MAG TPA: glycine cleavage system protein H [Terriglobales bacterium]|jgi:glycine cleavage system H lipoate-binding protein|nr:glycine cleavage system protein H [Terriglobales bacterium]